MLTVNSGKIDSETDKVLSGYGCSMFTLMSINVGSIY